MRFSKGNKGVTIYEKMHLSSDNTRYQLHVFQDASNERLPSVIAKVCFFMNLSNGFVVFHNRALQERGAFYFNRTERWGKRKS